MIPKMVSTNFICALFSSWSLSFSYIVNSFHVTILIPQEAAEAKEEVPRTLLPKQRVCSVRELSDDSRV